MHFLDLRTPSGFDVCHRIVRHTDDLVEFRKAGQSYLAICWQCRGRLHWDNWTSHTEPIRTWCPTCEIHISLVHLNLEPHTHVRSSQFAIDNSKSLPAEALAKAGEIPLAPCPLPSAK